MDFLESILGEIDTDTYEDYQNNDVLTSNLVWRDLPETAIPRAHLDAGSSTAWDVAKEEFRFIKQKLCTKFGTSKPKIETLVKFFFGSNSVLAEYALLSTVTISPSLISAFPNLSMASSYNS